MSSSGARGDGSDRSAQAPASVPEPAEAASGCGGIPPARRTWVLALAWGALYGASPGVAFPGGSALLALFGFTLWAWVASKPGRRAFWVEAIVGCAGWCGLCSWSALVHWGSLLVIGPGLGLYMAASGALLRRLRPRAGLAWAAPAAWLAIEVARSQIPPPYALPWMRAGVYLHEHLWIASAARVVGVHGLSWVLLALAGALAELLDGGGASAARGRGVWIAGTAPLALAILLGVLVGPPETVDGPRVMTVQPAIPQERKQAPISWTELFERSLGITATGLGEAEEAGEPVPEIVVWGETMLFMPIFQDDLLGAWDRGARAAPWRDYVDRTWLEESIEASERTVADVFFGQGRFPRFLPPSTSFVAGAVHWLEHGGTLRRQNAAGAWGPDGVRRGVAAKIELAPGSERLLGLERFAWARDLILSLADYVPDHLPADRVEILELPRSPGASAEVEEASWRIATTICFDNAFDHPYLAPVRRAPVDFHLVLTNEAWFRDGLELDQMLAFSRLRAIQSGRSLLRCANSGVSALYGPDGEELARLRVGDRDREVAGTLRCTVPVPVEPGGRTPYVRFERILLAVLGLGWIPVWLLGRRRRSPGTPVGASGTVGASEPAA